MNDQATELKSETPEEQESLFKDIYDLEPYEKSMKNARIWLYVISGFQFAVAIYEYSIMPDPTSAWIAFGIDTVLALVFLGLALWSRKKPVPAFTLALSIYVIVQSGIMILDTSTIVKGVLIKILVVIALVKANRDARKYEELKSLQ
jgi:ribose/xylose/arabinose/galactoside ABC-type transport system permease subunit